MNPIADFLARIALEFHAQNRLHWLGCSVNQDLPSFPGLCLLEGFWIGRKRLMLLAEFRGEIDKAGVLPFLAIQVPAIGRNGSPNNHLFHG
jgi:hypothetical protein